LTNAASAGSISLGKAIEKALKVPIVSFFNYEKVSDRGDG
jgi:hypothetical protein